jgi:hypothetical protein
MNPPLFVLLAVAVLALVGLAIYAIPTLPTSSAAVGISFEAVKPVSVVIFGSTSG